MSIEERILRLSMDDGDFQRGADGAITKLEELKAALEFGEVSGSADAARAIFGGIDEDLTSLTGTCAAAANSITSVFTNAWNLIYAGFMQTIGSNLANGVVNLVNQCSIAPITDGWAKYEESVNAVQKIVINTGWAIEDVEARLNVLATYSDQTSYGFTDMTNALATFVSAGNNLDDSVTAIIGLSDWAATAGVNASQAAGAYDMFSKSIQAGYMSLQQWYSLQKTYNMGTVQFYNNLHDSAVAMGMMRDNADGTVSVFNRVKGEWDEDTYETVAGAMQQTLKYQWLTDDVLYDVMAKYGDTAQSIMELLESGEVETVDEAVKALGIDTESFGYKAMQAAQEAKTLTDTVGAWRDVVSTQYRGVFEDLFGNYEEAADFWTDVCDTLGGFFWDLPTALHAITSEWHGMNAGIGDTVWQDGYTNYMAFTEGIVNVCEAIVNLKDTISDAFSNVFGELDAGTLADITNNFALFAYELDKVWLSADNLERIGSVVEGLLTPFKTLIDLVSAFAGVMNDSAKEGSTWTDEWGNVHEEFGWVATLKPILEELGNIIEYVSDAFKELDKAFRNQEGEISLKPFDKLVAIFKDVYKIVSELGGLIGDTIGHFLGLDTSMSEGNGLTGAIDSVVDALKDLFEWIKKLETPMQTLNSWLGENSSKLGLSQNLQTANGDVVDLGHSMEDFQVTYEEARDTLSSGSWNLLESIYGGKNPKETWKNVMKEWDSAKKVMSTGEEKVDGMSFGEWLNSQVQSADVDNFTLFVSKIKNAIDQLPDIKDVWSDFWQGFQGANEKYGFDFPTSLQDFIDDLRDFVDKLKEYTGMDGLADTLGNLLPEGTIDTSKFTSFMSGIGEIVGVISGISKEWKTDRLEDIPVVFETIKNLFKIIGKIAKEIAGVFSDGEIDLSKGGIVTKIDSISEFISKVIEAVAVLVDAIGVAIGATDGTSIEKYGEDLGKFSDTIVNIGTIIGNLLDPMINILKTLWGFVAEASGALAGTTGTTGFQQILSEINEVLSWVGETVVKLINWANKLLADGVSEADVSSAGSLLTSVVTMLKGALAPIKEWLTSGSFDLSNVGVGTDTGAAASSLAEALFQTAAKLCQYGVQYAAVITEAAGEVAINLIKTAGKIVIELLKQVKVIVTQFQALGGFDALAGFFTMIGEINIGLFVTSVTKLISSLSVFGRMKLTSSWAKDYSEVLVNLGKFLLMIVAAIVVLGYMATHHTAELIAGTAAVVILCAALTAAIIYLYYAFMGVTEAMEYVEGMKWYDMLVDSAKWYAIAAMLLGLAVFFGIVLAAIIALTAVTAAFPRGMSSLIASFIVVILAIVALLGAITWVIAIIEGMATKLAASGGLELGPLVASLAIFAVIAVVLTTAAGGIALAIAGLTALLAVIDVFTGGNMATYLHSALAIMLVAFALLIAMVLATASLLAKVSTIKMPTMSELGKLAAIGALLVAMVVVVELLVAGIAGIMVALTFANDLEWETLLQGIVLLTFIAGLTVAFIMAMKYVASIDKTKIEMPSWNNLAKIAVIILGMVVVIKSIVSAIYQLSMISTGDVDIAILWNVVAVMGVIALITYALINLTSKMDAKGAKISALKGSFTALAAMMTVMFGFMVLMMWILGKWGTSEINVEPLWNMVGVIAAIAAITALLAAASKYLMSGTSVAKLAVIMGAIVVTFGMLVLACKILSGIEPISSDATESIQSMLTTLVLIAGVAALAGMLVSLIPGVGELAVALGSLFAVAIGATAILFAAAIAILVDSFKELSTIDGDALVSSMDAIGEGFDKLFSHDSGLIALATGVAAACGILQPALSGIMDTVGVFAGAVIIAIALIAIAVLATGKDVEDIVNIISEVISKVAEEMPTWFEQILTAAGECMLLLTDFIVEYTPTLVEAALSGIGLAFGEMAGGLKEKATEYIEDKLGTGDSYKQQVYDKAYEEYDLGSKNLGQKRQTVNSDEWYLYSQKEYNAHAAENGLGRSYAFNRAGGYVTPYANIELDTTENPYAYADYIAEYMYRTPQNIQKFNEGMEWDLSTFLTDQEMAYFQQKYKDLGQMLDFEEVDDAEDKLHGQADGLKKNGEEITEGAESLGEGADAVEANADKLARAGDKAQTSAEDSADAVEEGTSTFASKLTSFTELFNELGQTETVEAAKNIMMKFNLIDENGNVISDTSTMDSLLGSLGTFGMGAADSEGNTLTTMQGVVDVILTGGKVTFNGQEIGIGTGTVSDAVSGMISEQGTTSDNKAVVEVTGSTFFNTSDIIGDAQTLSTEGVSVYQSTGQALGSALVSGFQAYANQMNGMGIKYANNAITQFRAQYSYAYWAGVYLAQGFINGMLSMIGEVDAAGQQLGQAGVDGLNKGAGNESPSHKTYQSGIYLAQGSINAMADMTSAVYEAGYEMGSAASDGFADGSSEWNDLISPVINSSYFQNGLDYVDSLYAKAMQYGDYTVTLNGRQYSTKQLIQEAYQEIYNLLYTMSNKDALQWEIQRLGDRLSELGFYVDGKQLTNAISPYMDTALAKAYTKRGRS